MTEIEYFCGIDVSKHSFSVAIKNGKFIVKDKVFTMNKEGFNGLENMLKEFKENLLIGMESTGIYHNNLFNFLREKGYNSRIVNPYMVFQFFKFSRNKPTRTDKKDAQTIANFLEFNKKALIKENYLGEEEKERIRYLVREKERTTHLIAQTKTEIRRILSVVFPEMEKEPGIFSQEILDLLSEFSSSQKIRTLPKEEFLSKTKEFREKGKGNHSKLSFERIYELANNSIAFEYPYYEELLKLKIKRLKDLLKEKDYINKIIEENANKIFKREIEILTSIPGIGRESAIYLMAELINIKRFENYRKLIGFCGLDPVIKQSGKFKASFRISKRGNAHARRIVWIMAGCVKKSCPYFREYYLKKRNEGKSYKEAVIATSTKLLRVIYALLSENRTFK